MIILGAASPLTQAADPFAELEQEMKLLTPEAKKKERLEFQNWKESYLKEYQTFREEHFNKLDDIRDQLIDRWGESVVSTQDTFVEYSDDQSIRSVFDFDKNQIRISVLHDLGTDNTSAGVEAKVEAILSQQRQQGGLLNQMTGDQPPNIDKLMAQAQAETQTVQSNASKLLAKEKALIKEQSLAQKAQVERLSDLVNADKSDSELAQTESKQEIELAAEKRQIEKEEQERLAKLNQKVQQLARAKHAGKAQPQKQVTTYTIPLGKVREMKLAKPYIRPVLEQAQRWELEPSLMMAIMHTESHFNPKAQSHIPAFGLMQIVPRTASIDVNRFLYQTDAAMSSNELFNPSKNIETGVAYMHILNSKYLKSIKNEQSRLYCVIAAYNTGAGNVAKTFNQDGSRNIKRAAAVINALAPAEVYERLVKHLPYQETRNYVKKVTKRQDIYGQLDQIL